jgi:hypothetical protein
MTRPEGLNADPQQPDALREPEPMRPLRKFQREIQALIRHLIKIRDLTGFVRNGEIYIRLSDIEPFTAGGADPLR